MREHIARAWLRLRLRLFGVRVTGNHPVLYLAGRSGRLLELHFKDAEIHFLFESVTVKDSRTVVDFEVRLDGQSLLRSIGPADCEPGDVLTFKVVGDISRMGLRS